MRGGAEATATLTKRKGHVYHFESFLKQSVRIHPIDMDVAAIFARNMKRLRAERGLTQAGLAELADISLMAVYNYEAAVRWPKAETIGAIAGAMNVPVGNLFDDPDSPATVSLDEALAVVARHHGYGLTKLPPE